MNSLEIRVMKLRDVYTVYRIEKESYNRPWPIGEFIKELNDNSYAKYFVSLLNRKIIGFLGMWIIVDEAHITNIAISKKYRRKGFASEILDFAENYARELKTKNCSTRSTIKSKNKWRGRGCSYD